MAYQQKDMSGVLFRNEKKNEKSPDYTGDVVIHGTKFRLAAWVRDSSKGNKFLSIAVNEDEERKPQAAPKQAPANQAQEDDLPF